VLNEEEGEESGEGEVRGLDEGGSGDGEARYAAGVEVVVEACEDSDDGGGEKERKFDGEEVRFW